MSQLTFNIMLFRKAIELLNSFEGDIFFKALHNLHQYSSRFAAPKDALLLEICTKNALIKSFFREMAYSDLFEMKDIKAAKKQLKYNLLEIDLILKQGDIIFRSLYWAEFSNLANTINEIETSGMELSSEKIAQVQLIKMPKYLN